MQKQPRIAPDTIRAVLLRLAAERAGRTFCPSEAARLLHENWRPLMPAVRGQGALLVSANRLRCTQRGRNVDPLSARGPVRLSEP